MEAAIFDLEGVLIDNRERLNYALAKLGAKSLKDISPRMRREFWKIFLDRELALRLDKVNHLGLQFLSDRARKYLIIIVSGAPRDIVNDHILKIKEYAKEQEMNIRIDRVYWRLQSKLKAAEFKKRIFASLAYELKIIEVHDDDPDILEVAKKYSEKCYLWIDLKPQRYC